MKRITRTTLTLLAMLATSAGLFVSPGAAQADGRYVMIGGVQYEDLGITDIGGGGTVGNTLDSAGSAVDSVLQSAKGAACTPKTTTTRFDTPSAHVYYGVHDSVYMWSVWAEAEITGCPDNVVTIRVQMRDRALDATSHPVDGDEATASERVRAGALAELVQKYSNVAMSTGLSYHALTTTVFASQTDGKVTTKWCTAKTWTYLATIAGPQFVGETPAESVKCP